MSDPKIMPADLQSAIRNIPDFPKPGIQFKDITPVLANARLFNGCIDLLTANHRPGSVDAVVTSLEEVRGAILGIPPAERPAPAERGRGRSGE